MHCQLVFYRMWDKLGIPLEVKLNWKLPLVIPIHFLIYSYVVMLPVLVVLLVGYPSGLYS